MSRLTSVHTQSLRRLTLASTSAIVALSLTIGCAHPRQNRALLPPVAEAPKELDMRTLPTYRVAAPDILVIEAVNNIRTADAPLRVGDQLLIQLKNGLPLDPQGDPMANPLVYEAELQMEAQFKILRGTYLITANGKVDLGPAYGQVAVLGMTVPQAQQAILDHLRLNIGLTDPELTVSLPDITGRQPIEGEHLVRPDGSVSLGVYGNVHVAGMTLEEVKAAVEQHLSRHIQQPEVRVDVLAYNSKVYYVITDGGGSGEQVARLPCTGNETVLDAISQIEGLSAVSSKHIWIARPAPAGAGCAQIMEVEWADIASLGVTDTNYQILPGDRIYIEADRMIQADTLLAKILAPYERLVGVTLLTVGAASRIQFYDQYGNNGGANTVIQNP